MPRRKLTNRGMWALEDAYRELLEIERRLYPLLDEKVTRTTLISQVAAARLAASRAMLRITEAHPEVRQKVISR